VILRNQSGIHSEFVSQKIAGAHVRKVNVMINRSVYFSVSYVIILVDFDTRCFMKARSNSNFAERDYTINTTDVTRKLKIEINSLRCGGS